MVRMGSSGWAKYNDGRQKGSVPMYRRSGEEMMIEMEKDIIEMKQEDSVRPGKERYTTIITIVRISTWNPHRLTKRVWRQPLRKEGRKGEDHDE